MKIQIKASTPYEVQIGPEVMDEIGRRLREHFSDRLPQRVALFTDSNVNEIYGNRVQLLMELDSFEVHRFVFHAGEASKNLGCIAALYDFLAERQFTRADVIVALGGGVTGDMAGFGAATYLRGIPFVQIPTSLLAAIDSSVGGKTGINLHAGKNLVGAFWQPAFVLCDTNAMTTLTPATFAEGMAEAIKTGAIRDKSLFDFIADSDFSNSKEQDHQARLQELIGRCIAIKGTVVEQDEREGGLRRILNFGHTLGHAIEAYYDYKIQHGNAVAIGMVEITRLAEERGLTESGTTVTLRKVLTEKGLPTSCDAPLSKLWEIARGDKKAEGDKLHLILLHNIGSCYVHPVTLAELEGWV